MPNNINALDPNHSYIFRSAEFGAYPCYWYKDRAGNYWKYSNAPEDHADHEIYCGPPVMEPDQIFMHEYPKFFTPEGYRRNVSAPDTAAVLKNPEYDRKITSLSWYEYYMDDAGDLKYIYLEKDIKENPNLYVQYNIRVTDAGLTRYRKYAAELFQNTESARDKALGCMLQLVDQAYFQIDQLADARVADIDFIDETVYLLGKKLRVDIPIYDFLTSIVSGRPITEPLFVQDTLHGVGVKFGLRTLSAVFAYLRVSPVFLQYWHATHIFSRIVNKHSMLGTPADAVEGIALEELAKVFSCSSDIKYLVDPQVSNTLLRNYAQVNNNVVKSLTSVISDTMGVAQVFSDLVERRGDELAFSQWLHAQPLHYSYEGEGQEIEQALMQQQPEKGPEKFVDADLDGAPDYAIDDATGEPPLSIPTQDL